MVQSGVLVFSIAVVEALSRLCCCGGGEGEKFGIGRIVVEPLPPTLPCVYPTLQNVGPKA